jgi:hypothetical protein
MNDATRARARAIAVLIRSLRVKRGSLSIASRMKEGNIDSYAEHLAKVYANNTPTEVELIRSLNLHAGNQPQCFNTHDEVVKANRQRIAVEETRKQIIHDVTRSVIKCLTAEEKLSLANGSGLPRRFELKIYGGDDE